MGRILKLLLVLVVLAVVGLIGYAYLGDLSPDQQLTSRPIVIEVE